MNLAPYRKLIAALVGAAAEAVALGVLDAKVLAIVVAFLTAAGVYQVPNQPLKAERKRDAKGRYSK